MYGKIFIGDDEYTIGEDIYRGKFSVVCELRGETGEEYIVKFPKSFSSEEVKIQKSLSSPYVVKCYKSSRKNKFLILEKCVCTLKEVIKGKKYRKQRVIRHIALGLKHIHSFGVIHRDLKLENVLLGVDEKYKITDFGFSVVSERATGLMGTPYYVAPEIINGERYDKNVDMWAFGIIIYYIYYGKMPFRAKSKKEIFEVIKECKYQLPNTVPLVVRDIIVNLLTLDPASRYTVDDILNHPYFSKSTI